MTVEVPPLNEAKEEYVDPWEMLHGLAQDIAEQCNEELEDIRNQQSQANRDRAQMKQRITSNAEELGNQSQNIQGAFAKLSAIEDEIENLEEDNSPSKDQNSRDETDQTPLEEVVTLPEELAKDELTANQERARFLAKDVTDYAQKVPAGLVIDSSTIRKVIKAKEGQRPHTQTVARIMEFLNDLGKEDTSVVKRRGSKMVSFSEELVKKLERSNHTRCDRGKDSAPPKGVITG